MRTNSVADQTAKTALAFELDNASVSSSSSAWLDVFEWSAPAGHVSVLLGPGGTGKSRFLRLLAGKRPSNDWHLDGTWLQNGKDLRPIWRDEAGRDDIVCIPQRSRSNTKADEVPMREKILTALRSDASIVLLDEPNSWFKTAEWTILVRAIHNRPDGMTVVMVSHVQSLAREVGDYCSLMAGKTIHGPWSCETFFQTPPSRLVARFVSNGNVWPNSSELDVPSHFHWLIPARLAGMGRPGLLRDAEDDVLAIARAGLSRLVSLTETAWDSPLLQKYGIHGTHFPIPDMGVPSINGAARQCRQIERWLETKQRTVLHCRAGLGRTGTMLAAYLIWTGTPAEDAVRKVRAINSKFIQSDAQLRFLERFDNAI